MKKLYLLLAAVIIAGCEKPTCENSNPVFNANLPHDETYKAELAQLIEKAGADNLDYYIDSYKEKNGERQLIVEVQGDGLCAKAVVLITDHTEGMENLIRVKGMSYGHAELMGFDFDIQRNNGQTSFIYKDVDYIVD